MELATAMNNKSFLIAGAAFIAFLGMSKLSSGMGIAYKYAEDGPE